MKFAVFIFVTALAFWIGKSSHAPAPMPECATAPSPANCGPADQGKDKLQQILDSDYADYLRLKTLEEKYKKADEILGKMMMIFLADFQLHAEKPQPAVAAKSEAVATPAPRAFPTPRPRETARPHVPYMNVHQVRDIEQTRQFLSSKRKENLQPTWNGGHEIRRYPPNLEGCFVGNYVADKDGEVAPTTMFHKIVSAREAVSTIVTRFKNGGVNRTRGNGLPHDYRQGEGQEVMIASGDWIYDIYYVPNIDGWIGNVYQKQKDESRAPIGIVQLYRGNNCEQ